MNRLIIVLTFGLLTNVYGQSFSKLEKVLAKELPENSPEDGRWVFYPDKAKIEKINKPAIKSVVPKYDFYKVTLTNYLGYHINQGTCVVAFDSVKSKIILMEPLWYGDISEPFMKLFIKKKFDNKDTLLLFLEELHGLMEVGSGYKFVRTSSTDHTITYDLIYLKDYAYTTGGIGTSSTLKYNQDGIWRQIIVDIDKLKFMRYTFINPATKDKGTIK